MDIYHKVSKLMANRNGTTNSINEIDLNSEEASNLINNQGNNPNQNIGNESNGTSDPNLGGMPFTNQGKASGGWSVKPEEGGMFAQGANSLVGMTFPDAEGGNTYTITALKNSPDSTANLNGFADPNTFIDRPGQDPWYSPNSTGGKLNIRQPLTSEIIKWAQDKQSTGEGGGRNKRPYKYTDFVFCKYWNKIPNNYMMTLRRFPYPTFDNLQFPGENGGKDVTGQKYYAPIAQAITYMGDDPGNKLSSMVSFSAGLPYESQKAEVHTISGTNPGAGDGPAGGLAKVLGILTGEANFETISKAGRFIDPYDNGPYMNKVLGPLNRIDSTMQRQPGLTFDQKFELKFHYIARPVGGVNTKVVMLDLLANLLTLTYAEASFWGGSHRFTGGRPAYPFLGGAAGVQAMFSGDMGGFYEALSDQISRAGSTVSDIFNSLLSGNPIEGLKNLASGGAKLGIANMLANKRPAAWQLPALLTGNPVGEWHLTVGNPLNPIMEIGNLICTKIDIEFGDEMGPDDFPLEMTATISLDHGMPRDKASVESMFNRGGGKIYHIPDEYQFGVGANSLSGTAIDKATTNDYNKSLPAALSKAGLAVQTVHKNTSSLTNGNDIDRITKSTTRDYSRVSKNLLETAKMVTGYATGKD